MKQRFSFSEAIAQQGLHSLKKAIGKSLPNEWRFTRHPSGFFLICDVASAVKYFGISYRLSPFDERLRGDIDTCIKSQDNRMESKQWNENIEKLKSQFQKIIQYSESEVCHEIKTVYEPGWGIHDIQKGFEETKKYSGRPITVKIEREAFRPNAIIMEGEIWARQDVWIRLDKPGIEYLLFERLTTRGLDKACIKVFAFHANGTLETKKGIPISPRPVYLPRHKPPQDYDGFHTESYWSLPTEIEKVYLDLLFKQRKSQRDGGVHLDSDENRMISIIRKILETKTD
jgi:hypothetical protein